MLGCASLDYIMLDFWVIWCQKHPEGITKNSLKHIRWITLGCVRIDFFVSLYLSKLSLHPKSRNCITKSKRFRLC